MPDRASRRRFLHQSSAVVAMAGLRPLRNAAAAINASSEIIIGVIGCGGRARQLMDQMPAPGRIVALCDCYLPRAAEAAADRDSTWSLYQDYRAMLDREKLDAVVVATPDHARTLPCMHAILAGLDVYAEKPLTAYVREGRVLVDAVRQHDRVFQVGTQQRTMEINEFCCRFIREGSIGSIKKVSAVNYPGPRKYTGLPEEQVPEGDDWNAWCGPTELRPFNSNLQFGWMGWWAYSGGEMTNWGAHGVDQIQWALGKDNTGPTELWPAKETGYINMRYDDGVEVAFEREGGPMGGAVFIGNECKMEVNRNRFATNPKDFVSDAPEPANKKKWEGDGWIARPHIKNWLDCIESRKLPNADVEIGHRSVSICHLVNITRELGRKLIWNPAVEQFENDAEANALLDRPRRAGFELPEV